MKFRAHTITKKQILSFCQVALGSFVIVSGWSWYHFSRRNHLQFVLKALAVWVVLAVLVFLGKKVYLYLARRFHLGSFWREEFYVAWDGLFLRAAFLFLIFFSTNEFVTLVYSSFIFWLFFQRLQQVWSRHPAALALLKLNRTLFCFGYFLFLVETVLQYSAFHYYILDANIKYPNIVFFRSIAMTLFWLAGFALASTWAITWRKWIRYVGFALWGLVFVLMLVAWALNEGVLYYSGLYLSPVALQHASGAGSVVFNTVMVGFVLGFVVTLVFFFFTFRPYLRAHRVVPKRFWHAYNIAIVFVAVAVVVGLTSFRNTPEFTIVKSFYAYYLGKDLAVKLDPAVQKKLNKFGLEYDPETFYVHNRSGVFTPTSTVFLPKQFSKTKPNVVIIYVESFSARFSGVYNKKLAGVTPHFDAFASDPHTTLFRNYYNASTPTITGTLSQQCSFLPPMGHNEIENDRKLQNHHLLCLPEILKKYAGFKYAAYITAVEKEYANKDGIFRSMGVDTIFGTRELAKYIKGEPLSWGYSDHQLFPALWNFMQTKPQPFLFMLATVDTHPPFNLPKDPVNYGDGSQRVLNMFHTTDDAFGKFWQQFKVSPFASNTMVLVAADHAIFPGAVTKDLFPEDGGKMTFYDQNFLALYIPNSVLPKEVNVLSSGIDELPTLLQIFGINIPNSFEGHSIFDDRKQYPNILGMHELGLYINQETSSGQRKVDYDIPSHIECPADYAASSTLYLTLCDYKQFYRWKRQMLEEGRFWKH